MTQENVKKIDDDVMSANCGIIVTFPNYDQFGAIQKLILEIYGWNNPLE